MTAADRFVTRRTLLGAAFGSVLLAGSPAIAAPSRAAIVDWALLETSLALGLTPVAAVELVLFETLVIEPRVPHSVVDLGLRGSINFELVATIAPDIIYGSNYSAWSHDLLERIAPVRSLPIYERGEAPYAKAEAAMRAMAGDFGIPERAESYIATAGERIAALGARLAHRRERPVFIVNIGDPRHFRAFGEDSMFGDVLSRMGFANAWGPQTSYSANAPVGIEALATAPEALVVIIGPVPPDARRVLPESALWQAMPAVREGRVVTLDPINPFGGLPAAERFARLFAQALEASP